MRRGELAGRAIDTVPWSAAEPRHALPGQLTADACGLPVLAGPVEAAALGNALVQARGGGVLAGGLAELRALIRRTHDVRLYLPSSGAETAWQAAEARLGGAEG